jgi:ketosteroid isomerase-like protein
MSKNLDVVRSIYADWERGDFRSVDWAHSQIEFAFVDGPEPGRSTGIPGMRAAWQRLLSGFVAFRTEASRYRELRDGRIVVLTRFVGHAKRSGFDLSEMPTEQAAVFEMREEKVARIELHWDAERLLADLCLAE